MKRGVFGRETVYALTASEAAAWDRAAQSQGVEESELMLSAAGTVAAVTAALFPEGNILVAVGSGHNGGDALLAARELQRAGRSVVWIASAGRIPDLPVLRKHGVPRADGAIENELAAADVVIDGILGTGSHGAPRQPASAHIRAINNSGLPVVAVDLPSGVNATTGAVEAEAIQAAVTVTFGAAKTGLMLHPARACCGRLIVTDIGFPPLRDEPGALLITPEWAWQRLPRRKPDAHKGSSGRVLMLVGSYGMAGAAAISARAAVHAGAGLVRIASDAENRTILQTRVPEATFFDRNGDLPVEGIHALVAGCGIGTDAVARSALERALAATAGLPAILDADALNLYKGMRTELAGLAATRPLIITPHVREFSRVSGWSDDESRADPIGRAREFASQTNCVVLLKGQPSIVAAPGKPVLINTVGSSDTASGGMGDQLSGMIGSMLAARAGPREAAALALFFGGRAADIARRGRSLTPDDVSNNLYASFRSPGKRVSELGDFVTFDQPSRW